MLCILVNCPFFWHCLTQSKQSQYWVLFVIYEAKAIKVTAVTLHFKKRDKKLWEIWDEIQWLLFPIIIDNNRLLKLNSNNSSLNSTSSTQTKTKNELFCQDHTAGEDQDLGTEPRPGPLARGKRYYIKHITSMTNSWAALKALGKGEQGGAIKIQLNTLNVLGCI